LGSESGSTKVLRSIGKRHSAEDIFDISAKMVQRGIVPMNNFLFGFPGETAEDRADTTRLIYRLLKLPGATCHFTYRHYQPVRGTPVGDEALSCVPDRPRRIDQWLENRSMFDLESVRTMPWIPAADELAVKQLINFELPLATSKIAMPSPWHRAIYRACRARARKGLRLGGQRRPLDRWLCEGPVTNRLDRTYIP